MQLKVVYHSSQTLILWIIRERYNTQVSCILLLAFNTIEQAKTSILYQFVRHVNAHNVSFWSNQLAEHKRVAPSTASKVKNVASLHCFRERQAASITPSRDDEERWAPKGTDQEGLSRTAWNSSFWLEISDRITHWTSCFLTSCVHKDNHQNRSIHQETDEYFDIHINTTISVLNVELHLELQLKL